MSGKTLLAALCLAALVTPAFAAEPPAAAAPPPAAEGAKAPAKAEELKPKDPAKAEAAAKAAQAGEVEFKDGRYRLKDGTPTYKVTDNEGGGKKVDWASWQGFRRYHDACHVCHGPNGLGSTFAPGLADSLKTMDYDTFIQTVSMGREVNRAGTEYVMPAFATNRDVMCYIDDIYTYLKGRSTDATPPGRPQGREDISDEAKKTAAECIGE